MKWIKSNGKKLEVRDVGHVIYEMVTLTDIPLPILDAVLADDKARERLEGLRATGHYGGRVVIK